MSKICSKNTAPEKLVRSYLHKLGYRYRLHRRDLPGKPDIVFPRNRIALFVNGCFWHGCRKCNEAHIPKTNSRFWKEKIERNIIRDKNKRNELKKAGWKVGTVWECELRDVQKATKPIIKMLNKV